MREIQKWNDLKPQCRENKRHVAVNTHTQRNTKKNNVNKVLRIPVSES